MGGIKKKNLALNNARPHKVNYFCICSRYDRLCNYQ